MTRKFLAVAGVVLTLGACTGPPPPKMVDAFTNVHNANAAAVPET